MHLIKQDDYLKFRDKTSEVKIENVTVKLKGPYEPKAWEPPEDYTTEKESVWSFPDRGTWATHVGNYRGNWSPYVPRNVILRYSEEGDTVLDQMCGSGTTLVECELLNRRGIGVDINEEAVMVSRDRLWYQQDPENPIAMAAETYVGDARSLNKIDNGSIDLIATHPPYSGMIAYTSDRVDGDLSSLKLEAFLAEMEVVANEALRVVKPGGHCAILFGDTRKDLHFIPVAIPVMQAFLNVGFLLREDVIKLQWKTKVTRERWGGSRHNFLRIAHEHLFIFRKPDEDERTTRLRFSKKWW